MCYKAHVFRENANNSLLERVYNNLVVALSSSVTVTSLGVSAEKQRSVFASRSYSRHTLSRIPFWSDVTGTNVLLLLFFISCVARTVRGSLEGVDPNTLSCDPKGQVFLLLPHYKDCTKFFMCVHGEEVLFPCPANLYFDFVLQVCNWKDATTCILRRPPSDGDDIDVGSGENWLTDNADLPFDGSLNSITGDAVANKIRPIYIEPPGKSGFNTVLNCLRPDDASRLVVYKGDCQRYWHCVNGVPQTAFCTDGLYFNERTQQCDFEANVKCSVEQEDELNGEFLKVPKKK